MAKGTESILNIEAPPASEYEDYVPEIIEYLMNKTSLIIKERVKASINSRLSDKELDDIIAEKIKAEILQATWKKTVTANSIRQFVQELGLSEEDPQKVAIANANSILKTYESKIDAIAEEIIEKVS